MATKTDKTITPPLVSYSSFINFMNQLREHGSVPGRIDKTLMPKASGSQSSAMLSGLRSMSLIDDAGIPSDEFKKLVLAADADRKPILHKLLTSTYGFLLSDSGFDLAHATSGQVAEKFRALDISGSTVTKAIAFFLAGAKEAGIKVSAHVKAPPAPKVPGAARRASKQKEAEGNAGVADLGDLGDGQELERFEIPIPGKASVKVIVPSDLDADDWEMLQNMMSFYIKRWKGFKTKEVKEGQ